MRKTFFLFLPTDLTYQLSKVASKPNLQKLPSLKIKIRSLVLHISCKTFTQAQCLKTTKKVSFYNIASEASYVNAKILWYHKCKQTADNVTKYVNKQLIFYNLSYNVR